MRRIVSLVPALIVFLTAFGMLFVGPMIVREVGYAQTGAAIELASDQIENDDILARIDRAQTAVARKVIPSVVHINSRRGSGGWSRGGASGTGWVYDNAGYIVTNAHVVGGADTVRVQFENGLTSSASIVGTDPFTDIAVLEIERKSGLFEIERASSDVLERGQQVFAFGSPFGFKFSMSQGIISGLGRDPAGAVLSTGFTNFIQSDAAVNPGNSGGPLVDTRGRIVGMNVAIATGRDNDGRTTEGGQSAGISFAIPINVIESVADQLIEHGEVRRGFLGVSFPNRGPEELPVETEVGFWGVGVPVDQVSQGFPADRAGMRAGDMIVEFNGRRVGSRAVLRSMITSTGPGEAVEITVFRDGEFIDLNVVLTEFSREQLSIAPVLQEMGRLGVRLGGAGDRPFVRTITTDGAAAQAGLRQGMLVVGVGEERVETIGELSEALTDAGFLEGRSVTLLATVPMSGDEPVEVTLRRRR